MDGYYVGFRRQKTEGNQFGGTCIQPQAQKLFHSGGSGGAVRGGPNTVTRWVRKGRLPCIRTPGGRRRYPVEAITRLVREFQEGDPVSRSAEHTR